MGLFKTAEERAAAQAASAEHKASAHRKKDDARYLRSPMGRAAAALERGDSLFQLALAVGDGSAETLSSIEALGWRLNNAGYAYEVDVTSISNGADQVSNVYSSGKLMGVYVFRRI